MTHRLRSDTFGLEIAYAPMQERKLGNGELAPGEERAPADEIGVTHAFRLRRLEGTALASTEKVDSLHDVVLSVMRFAP